MRDADNINAFISNQVEDNMLAQAKTCRCHITLRIFIINKYEYISSREEMQHEFDQSVFRAISNTTEDGIFHGNNNYTNN